MKLTITIQCNNAAFADGGIDEARRILNEWCDRYADIHSKLEPARALSLYDIKGNVVGKAKVSA